jgi:hypothetical protein
VNSFEPITTPSSPDWQPDINREPASNAMMINVIKTRLNILIDLPPSGICSYGKIAKP